MGPVCHKGTLVPGQLRVKSLTRKSDVVARLPHPAKVAPRPNVHSALTFVPGLGTATDAAAAATDTATADAATSDADAAAATNAATAAATVVAVTVVATGSVATAVTARAAVEKAMSAFRGAAATAAGAMAAAKVAPRPDLSALTFVPGLGLVAVVSAAGAADATDAAVHGAV